MSWQKEGQIWTHLGSQTPSVLHPGSLWEFDHTRRSESPRSVQSVASRVWPKRCVCIVFLCFYHRQEGLLFSWVPLDDLCFACCVLVSRQKVWVMPAKPATVHFLCSLFSYLMLDYLECIWSEFYPRGILNSFLGLWICAAHHACAASFRHKYWKAVLSSCNEA